MVIHRCSHLEVPVSAYTLNVFDVNNRITMPDASDQDRQRTWLPLGEMDLPHYYAQI